MANWYGTWYWISSPSVTDVEFSFAFEETEKHMAVRLVRVSHTLDICVHPWISTDGGGQESCRQGTAEKSSKDQTAFVQVHDLVKSADSGDQRQHCPTYRLGTLILSFNWSNTKETISLQWQVGSIDRLLSRSNTEIVSFFSVRHATGLKLFFKVGTHNVHTMFWWWSKQTNTVDSNGV